MRSLPEGTVTFLFSDVEGSTTLLEEHGAAMGSALASHHELFEEVVGRHDGVIFETVGDAVYAAFARPADAVSAAIDAQRELLAHDWGPIESLKVRIACHSGHVERRGAHYFGPALFRASRLQALAHGGQVLVSGVTSRLVDDLPPGAALRDLGLHRLKDLGEPERVFEATHPDIPDDHPPIAGLDAHRHNLPIQLSSFVGRQTELASLAEQLVDHRLVTLIGPPGIGKSRLALQAAADRLGEFEDGAFLVELATVGDIEAMIGAIAAGVQAQPHPRAPMLATLCQHLADRRLLLILDNVEHLLPDGADVVAELLTRAPEVRVLATSRAPIRLRGEHEFLVPPLGAGRMDHSDPALPDAVALFVERARSIRPELVIDATTGPAIVDICSRLDGLPLAIELAAARMRMFNLESLRERLTNRLALLAGGARDLPERQRTLRSAIAWSEELLAPAERAVFARLGVFVGGFSLDAAEAIATGDESGSNLLEALDHLVEQSLVRRVDWSGPDLRYELLQTVREYALERLADCGDEEVVRDRHVAYFVAMTEAAYAQLPAAASRWLPLLDLEQANIRGALEWSESRDPHANAALAGAIATHWYGRGLLREVRQRLATALRAYIERDRIRARVLVHAADVALRAGGSGREQAVGLVSEALDISRENGDRRSEALALELSGQAHNFVGRDAEARAALELSRAIREEDGASEIELAGSIVGLCFVHIVMGDPDAAEPMARRILDIGVRHDSVRFRQSGLHYLADVRLLRGEFAEAAEAYSRALEHAQRHSQYPNAAHEMIGVAMSLAGQGQHERALALAATASLRREILGVGRPYIDWWDRLQDRHLGEARAALPPERVDEIEQSGHLTPFDEAVADILGQVSPDPPGTNVR
jgi:predicted ATPase/class 3 adenylate cyclase